MAERKDQEETPAAEQKEQTPPLPELKPESDVNPEAPEAPRNQPRPRSNREPGSNPENDGASAATLKNTWHSGSFLYWSPSSLPGFSGAVPAPATSSSATRNTVP